MIIQEIATRCQARLVEPEERLNAAAAHWENDGRLLVAAGPDGGYRIVEIEDWEDPQGFLDELLAPKYGKDEWPDENAEFQAFLVNADGYVEHYTGDATWRHGIVLKGGSGV